MKRNDIKALQDKSIAELNAQLLTLETEFAQARIKKHAGKLQNTHISLMADDIARIKTVIRQKELNG